MSDKADKAEVPAPYPGEFVRVVIGSTIHGLSIAKTDDLDLMGVCIEPPETILGMGKPFEQHTWRTQPEGHPSGPGDVDLSVYSLRKFLKLASNGNPTVLNLLFVPEAFRHVDGLLADELRALTPAIVSREAEARYLGYMKAQRERLLGLRGQKRSGYTRRLKYQAEAGWDTKYAMHLCRLAIQGIELLSTGRITFPVPEPHRSNLMAVRRGEWTLDQTVEWSNELEQELIDARDGSPLPEYPDRERLNEWLVEAYLKHWESPKVPRHMPMVEKEIRERDANFGTDLPQHYTGPLDRRYLIGVVDGLRGQTHLKTEEGSVDDE